MASEIKHMPAVRAFNRIIAPKFNSLEEAEQYDAHWDGGEWSGPAWANIYEDVWKDTLKLVAERFDITVAELDDSVHADSWLHLHKTAEAHSHE